MPASLVNNSVSALIPLSFPFVSDAKMESLSEQEVRLKTIKILPHFLVSSIRFKFIIHISDRSIIVNPLIKVIPLICRICIKNRL